MDNVGDSGFLRTQRVLLQAKLPRNAKIVKALIEAEAGRLQAIGEAVPFPSWSIPQLAAKAAMSPSTAQRTVRLLEVGGHLKCVRRPGLPYLLVPLTPGHASPPLPQQALPMDGAGAVLVPRTYAIRGTNGRFVAERDPHFINRSGQIDRTFSTGGPVKLTGPTPIEAAADAGGPVKLTGGSGQIDRGGPVKLTGPRPVDVPVLDRSREEIGENAALRADPTPDEGHLPLVGLSPDERYRVPRHDPAADGNYQFIRGRALEVGRADPPPNEPELRERVKEWLARHVPDVDRDTRTPEGDGILHMAVKVAWQQLVREKVCREQPVAEDTHGQRRRRRAVGQTGDE